MTCQSCGSKTTDGITLCGLCRQAVTVYLNALPIYFRNLARWRPGRTGTRQVPGSRVLYDGTTRDAGDKITDRLEDAAVALDILANRLLQAGPVFERPLTLADATLAGELPEDLAALLAEDKPQAVTLLCTALRGQVHRIATLPWAGELVQTIGLHESALRTLTEQSVPGWYAGTCRRNNCGADTYVVPGLTWVTCGRCGAMTYARDHLDAILEEARDWIARPKVIAHAVVALVDTEESVPRLYDRIRKWAEKGDVKAIRATEIGPVWSEEERAFVQGERPVGHPRYRFGDILDRVLARHDTRTQEKPHAS